MNSAVASSSVISRMPWSGSLGRRMKRSIFCGMRISAFIALPSLGARKLQRDREGEIGNERERMRRIDGERRQQREHVGEEALLQPGALGLLEIAAVDQRHAGGGQRRPQFQPALLLIAGELRHRLADAGELLGGGEPVRALGRDGLAAPGP